MFVREPISKSVRFEVFKRDKFTCQYCGSKSPEVVLNVDHIQPVAKGGTNEILNLITSCHSCNSGKGDRVLSDISMVEKQRAQLELLADRREQIELMLQWKKSLSSFDKDVEDMISEYVASKIQPLILNETGKRFVTDWLKKYDAEKILDAIDTSARQYLQYENGTVVKESADLFMGKVGGILVVKSLPPVKQKVAYIKGIARNRFSYWDEKKGSVILGNYVTELEQHFDESALLEDLEIEVTRITKEAKNWTEWKNTLEKWTSDIQGWKKESKQPAAVPQYSEYSLEQLENFVYHLSCEQEDVITALEHLATLFPGFEKSPFRELLYNDLIDFLSHHNDLDKHPQDEEEANDFCDGFALKAQVARQFEYDEYSDNLGVLMVLEPITRKLLSDIFSFCYYPTRMIKKEYLQIMIELNINGLIKKLT